MLKLEKMKFGVYTLAIESHMVRLPGFGMFDFGWGNGYVLLPFNHPFYGKDYDDIDIKIHGGLTFGKVFDSTRFLEWIENRQIFGDVTRENYEFFKNYWIIGFDTNHSGDDLQSCSKEYVIDETIFMCEQCLDDNVKEIRNYKYRVLRKDKLKEINASVVALSKK